MMATGLIAPKKHKHQRAQKARAQQVVVASGKPVVEAQEVYDWFHPKQLNWKNIDWPVLLWMSGIQLGCLAAPFFFSWKAVGLAIAMHWLTSSIGVCLGFHRYLSHNSFKLKKPAEFVVLLCSVASGQGSPLMWTAMHRLHHQRSDQEGDPHSPLMGKWWSHILWLFVKHTNEQRDALQRRYAPDLVDRPLLQFFERTYGRWMFGIALFLLVVGGVPGLVWALCVRMTLAYHSTWFVNSATHLWGYRNYETRDESRNLWWVALVAYGEGWHNNHHAHPHTARAGHHWWEIDMTWWAIRALRAMNLATHVDDRIPLKSGSRAAAAEA
jgi:stearoyl-CoA desaturase (delta-9 desaturase)